MGAVGQNRYFIGERRTSEQEASKPESSERASYGHRDEFGSPRHPSAIRIFTCSDRRGKGTTDANEELELESRATSYLDFT